MTSRLTEDTEYRNFVRMICESNSDDADEKTSITKTVLGKQRTEIKRLKPTEDDEYRNLIKSIPNCFSNRCEETSITKAVLGKQRTEIKRLKTTEDEEYRNLIKSVLSCSSNRCEGSAEDAKFELFNIAANTQWDSDDELMQDLVKEGPLDFSTPKKKKFNITKRLQISNVSSSSLHEMEITKKNWIHHKKI